MKALLDVQIKIYKFLHLDPEFWSLEIENFLNDFLGKNPKSSKILGLAGI